MKVTHPANVTPEGDDTPVWMAIESLDPHTLLRMETVLGQ